MVNEILQESYTTAGAAAESVIKTYTVPATETWKVEEVSASLDADHQIYIYLTERKRVTFLGGAGNTIDNPRLLNWELKGGTEMQVSGYAGGAGTSYVQLVVDKIEKG